MISNPKHGWCNFKLGTFEGTPSYLTDVPIDILTAFIDYHNKGCGVIWFDEEGTEFTLVITPYSDVGVKRVDKELHNLPYSTLKISHNRFEAACFAYLDCRQAVSPLPVTLISDFAHNVPCPFCKRRAS